MPIGKLFKDNINLPVRGSIARTISTIKEKEIPALQPTPLIRDVIMDTPPPPTPQEQIIDIIGTFFPPVKLIDAFTEHPEARVPEVIIPTIIPPIPTILDPPPVVIHEVGRNHEKDAMEKADIPPDIINIYLDNITPDPPKLPGLPNMGDIGKYALMGVAALGGLWLIGKYIGRGK